MVIPPKYSVLSIVGKIKANIRRQIRKRFSWVKEIYCRNEFGLPGSFPSTVGINEQVIRRCIEFQGEVEKGQVQLSFDFKLKVPQA
jgi:putative transposase